jgi:hypothetical protein
MNKNERNEMKLKTQYTPGPLFAAAPQLVEALKTLSISFGEGIRSGLLTQEMVDEALAALKSAGVEV